MGNVHTNDAFVDGARITDDSLTYKTHMQHLELSSFSQVSSAARGFPSRSRETCSRAVMRDIYVSDPTAPFVPFPALLNRICSGKIEQ